MKLCLGTVQFGMDYGIRGGKQPSFSQIAEMLDYAVDNGVDTLDTASGYGESEAVLGKWLKSRPIARGKIHLISKLSGGLLEGAAEPQYYEKMKESLVQSLSRLETDFLDGYLLHNAKDVFQDAMIDALARLKQEGLIRAAGVSVYEPEEAERGILCGKLDLVQLPYSLLDQRMLHGGIFPLAKQQGVTLHARGAFTQGLLLMEEQEVPEFLQKARPVVRRVAEFCEKNAISRVELALGFVKRQMEISHLVFGVDNLEGLKENIALFQREVPPEIIEEAAGMFAGLAPELVMPNHWKR